MSKERPILFSGAMVRALLTGTKTQTRRVVKPQPDTAHDGEPYWFIGGYRVWGYRPAPAVPLRAGGNPLPCPYGQPGDRLWVRETFIQGFPVDPLTDSLQQWDADGNELPKKTWYRADNSDIGWIDDDGWQVNVPWKPSIHMPRAASRITLEITSVRVERLQDISEGDAVAEGIEQMPCAVPDTRLWRNYDPGNGWTPSLAIPQNSFRSLWESINGPDSWDENPWVWVVAFSPPTTA